MDRGGWSSKGTEVQCAKCGEMGAMIETTIYGKTTISYFCNTCAYSGVTRLTCVRLRCARPVAELTGRVD
jgi:hypothetical protein